jgi:hypothetical protein
MRSHILALCRTLGLQAIELPPVVHGKRGRKVGQTEAARKERLEAHTAAMRERYGAVEAYEEEAAIFTPEKIKSAALAEQVMSNEEQRGLEERRVRKVGRKR